MTQLVLSLGSNIERGKHIRFALIELEKLFGKLEISPVYETRAVGFDGPDFFNLVVLINTPFEIETLIKGIQKVEADAGRVRGAKIFQSRNLDIDILLFGDADLSHQGRNIPRREIEHAAHVLKPLSDILPNMRHPVSGRRFDALWQEFDDSEQRLKSIDFDYDNDAV
jgi:2-amino-4-hydroxy-6-hydroxymethyldihydropteridine diphosphokinase